MAQEAVIKKVDDYLIQLNMHYEDIGDNTWVVHDEFDNIDNIVIKYEDPIIIFRVKLMNVPQTKKEEFFETLLRLNATSLVHGAYGLENGHVVIVDTLEAENLDYNEFQASIDAIIMAIAHDYKVLSQFLSK